MQSSKVLARQMPGNPSNPKSAGPGHSEREQNTHRTSTGRQFNGQGGSVGREVLRVDVAIVLFDRAVTDAQA